MFAGLGLAPLVVIFLAAAVTVWVAGILLSSSTDALDVRLGLGEAVGGAVLLAIATNLPEIAITASAALANDLGIAIGNILGGIAIQTVVLVLLDVAMLVIGDLPMTLPERIISVIFSSVLNSWRKSCPERGGIVLSSESGFGTPPRPLGPWQLMQP